ncbi:uncharacterized protein N7479_005016 [Penicillium vulpinum]|uniref:uncharacterized protein n=1 Tax=Penicillium vulpinum TaxID=29845 RepID=UPI0025484BE8|nr:uncharacterized protein N7479_005016 [Penicillium vulpinum]KAJ5965140.1 hypothetical protein N7479_005016 [Penicillium vulpinum]
MKGPTKANEDTRYKAGDLHKIRLTQAYFSLMASRVPERHPEQSQYNVMVEADGSLQLPARSYN